jgi:hypothetical protein
LVRYPDTEQQDRLDQYRGRVAEGRGKDMADASTPGPQTIAAVLADVDGTLVTKSKALTPRALEAVEELHERGVLFAITSGRPPRGMRMLVHPLEMRGPMAAFNGGIVVMPDMTIVDERAIPAEVAPAVPPPAVPWVPHARGAAGAAAGNSRPVRTLSTATPSP